MADLTARAGLGGGRVELGFGWSAPVRLFGLRIVRRRSAFPTTDTDGLVVLDFADLFVSAGVPWQQIVRARCLVTNSLAEGGLLQAELSLYTAPGAAVPARARIVAYSDAAGGMITVDLAGVTHVAVTGDTTEIFTTVAPAPESSAGKVQITATHFQWTPAVGPAIGLDFDRLEQQTTTSVVQPGATFSAEFTTTSGAEVLRVIGIEQAENADAGEWATTLTIDDREASTRLQDEVDPGEDPPPAPPPIRAHGLAPQTVYYYAAFPAAGGGLSPPVVSTASTMVTMGYGLGDRLYAMLPAFHRFQDERSPDLLGKGLLRRYLAILGAGLDQARSLGEGLSTLHDLFEVDVAQLPLLARWIGWEPDRTLQDGLQRSDILSAPEVFATVGTVPNLRAMVTRATGWDCEVKEFVDNVFLTNAVEPVHLWQIFETTRVGPDFGPVTPQHDLYPPALEPASAQARPDAFDGRPAAVLDAASHVWLFWHSQRPDAAGLERRRIWVQRLDGVDAAPAQATVGMPDDPAFIDEDPAVIADGARVWLFWSSNRDGSFDIWGRAFGATPASASSAVRLTAHPLDDRHPAAVRDLTGRLWVFWESSRRGPTDIWAIASTNDGVSWEAPRRITSADPRDHSPAAVVDPAGAVRLFWSADSGDRSSILQSVFDGVKWSDPQPATTAPALVRDESPAAVVWQNKLWLLWCSNRGGRWRVWAQVQAGGVWGVPFPISATHLSTDKEPAALVDALGALRVYLRSQQSGERFRSRTVDTSSPVGALALASMRTPQDRLHYTYDTRRTRDAWFARGAVGVYLALTPGDEPLDPLHLARVTSRIARARGFVASFKSVQTRLIWFVKQTSGKTQVVDTDG